jgi:hypothetical protein
VGIESHVRAQPATRATELPYSFATKRSRFKRAPEESLQARQRPGILIGPYAKSRFTKAGFCVIRNQRITKKIGSETIHPSQTGKVNEIG